MRAVAFMIRGMNGWDRVIAAVIDRRSEFGWTQKRLASEAGVAERTIQNLEGGKRPQPLIRGKIERALGWPQGEMRRIEKEDGQQQPLVPRDVLDAIEASVHPADRQRVIEAVERTLRGEPQPPTSPTAESQRRRRAG